MTEWKTGRVDSFFTLKRGFDLPSQNRVSGSIPIISSSGVTGFHNILGSRGPGVVTGRYGTIGEVFFAQGDYWPHNTTLYVDNFRNNYPRFVYYFLKDFDFEKFNDKSTVPGINRNHLHQETVSIPPPSEQEAIAEVLSSLDDKIDLLHRNNKSLEQLAETLFRQWFVEQAKESWEEVTLSRQLEFQYGKSLREDKRSGSGFPVFGSGGLAGYHNEFLVTGPGVIIGRKGTVGTVTYVFDNFFPIDTTFYIRSRRATINYLYEYHLLKILGLEEMNSDSAVPGLNRDTAMSLKTLLPPYELMKSYEEVCSSFFDKIKKNRIQIKQLETLRDKLLPKLMNGAVRVII